MRSKDTRSEGTRREGGHLSRIDLARLVDETPSPDERRHLEACERCMEELAALAAQTRALADLPHLQPSEEDWAVLQARLEGEGLMEPAAARTHAAAESGASSDLGSAGEIGPRSVAVVPVGSRRGRGRGWLQAAAGIALFVAGGITGSVVATRGGAEPGSGTAARTGNGAVPAAIAPADSEPSLQSSENLVRQAENLYLQALVDYRDQLDRSDASLRPRDPVGRLVVLENLLAASEAAVREDPADPFFNGLLVNTAAEHRATVEAMTATNTVSW